VNLNKKVARNLAAIIEQKNGAYTERDRCVAGIAALARRVGWEAWLGRHEPDPKWDQDWMTIVFIDLPTGQVSWHIHDSEVEWFSFLPTNLENKWDGHTTTQKYERLAALNEPLHPPWMPVQPHAPAAAFVDHYVGSGFGNVACPTCGTTIGRSCRFSPTEELAGASGATHVHGARASTAAAVDLADAQVVLKTRRDPLQCEWVYVDEDPDEGLWNCMHNQGHDGQHGYGVTCNPGVTTRWRLPVPEPEMADLIREARVASAMETLATADILDGGQCACSPKYHELTPGVHAAYCPLVGRPLPGGGL
jgi:hypothetical protein